MTTFHVYAKIGQVNGGGHPTPPTSPLNPPLMVMRDDNVTTALHCHSLGGDIDNSNTVWVRTL